MIVIQSSYEESGETNISNQKGNLAGKKIKSMGCLTYNDMVMNKNSLVIQLERNKW